MRSLTLLSIASCTALMIGGATTAGSEATPLGVFPPMDCQRQTPGVGSSDGINRLMASANWMLESNQASANLGYSVATAGDVNGDGYSDVIVGAPYYDNGSQADVGIAMLFLGSATGLSTTPAWTFQGDIPGCRVGISVSTAGDVNGDGRSDVIVGADAYSHTAMHEGRAFVFYGTPSGLSPTPNWYAESGQDSALFGISVATAGDVNGDGYADVIVGCPYYDSSFVNEGRAFIWFGGPSGLGPIGTPANADWSAAGGQAGAQLGGRVATAGDVNGDDYADVIVGAGLFDNGSIANAGRAVVFYGGPSGPSPSPNWTVDGDQAEANFGAAVATAGDVNGDGFADVIVGAPYYDHGQSNEGRAYVYLGSAAGLSMSPAWTAEGNADSALFGFAVGTAGDTNGDGYADVIVGAYQFTNDQGQEGRAMVYQGGPSGLEQTPIWTAEGNQDNALFGYSVSTAGDVNGDGYSDVIVGAIYYSNVESQEGRAAEFHGAPPLRVVTQPTSQAFCAGAGPASLAITATGVAPLSYQWRKAMTPLVEGGRLTGTTTPTLSILAPLAVADSGSYDCVVTDALGSATSNPATLAVWATGSGDVNSDGQTNTVDISPFVAALISGQAGQGNCAADMNSDGKVNGADVGPFVDRLIP